MADTEDVGDGNNGSGDGSIDPEMGNPQRSALEASRDGSQVNVQRSRPYQPVGVSALRNGGHPNIWDEEMICSIGKAYGGCHSTPGWSLHQLDKRTVSATAILSDEANQEIDTYLNSLQSIVNTQQQIQIGGKDDLVAYSLLGMSRA